MKPSSLLRQAIVALCVTVMVASAGLVLSFGHGRDQSIYALVARETLAGGMPYRDAFDFKPPGIFAVYALARVVSGSSWIGIRLLEVLAMAATALALARLARRELDRPLVGWVAGALAAAVHAQLDFWHTAQPETFGGPLALWSIALAAEAGRTDAGRQRALLLVGAGALCGMAGLMKPPLAGGAPIVAALSALLRDRPELAPRRRVRAAAEPFVLVASGAVAPLALTAAVFAARGALGDLHQVLFVFTPQYTKISWKEASAVGMLYRGAVEWLTVYSSALLGGLVLATALPWTRRERLLLGAALATCAVHVAGVAMQGKFFPYHWGATFPITALVAAWGYVALFERAAARHPALGAGVACLALAVASVHAPVPSMGQVFLDRAAERLRVVTRLSGDERTRALDGLASVADVDARHNREAAALVASRVPAGEPILVWGFEPAIYDLADRPTSTRFIYNVPQRALWSKDAMRPALMRDLEARPPAAIVVEHHDVFPFVTGDSLDSAASLEEFPELLSLVEREFELAGRAGDLEVWVRAAPPGG